MKSSPNHTGSIRLGLCCQFSQAPVQCRTTTALARLHRGAQLVRQVELCRSNADSLLAALEFCALTVEVGAKAKELPVRQLRAALSAKARFLS